MGVVVGVLICIDVLGEWVGCVFEENGVVFVVIDGVVVEGGVVFEGVVWECGVDVVVDYVDYVVDGVVVVE